MLAHSWKLLTFYSLEKSLLTPAYWRFYSSRVITIYLCTVYIYIFGKVLFSPVVHLVLLAVYKPFACIHLADIYPMQMRVKGLAQKHHDEVICSPEPSPLSHRCPLQYKAGPHTRLPSSRSFSRGIMPNKIVMRCESCAVLFVRMFAPQPQVKLTVLQCYAVL